MATEEKKDQPKADEKNLPANQSTGTALAVVEIDEEDRGAGLKNISNEERKIPFVRVLQTNSPECDDSDAKYVPGAKAGLIINTATKALYERLEFVAAARDHKFIEYTPRNLGSGFVAVHKPGDELILRLRAQFGRFGKLPNGVTKRNDKNEPLDGTEIVESYELYCIFIDPATGQKFRAIAPFQSTQISKYQNFIDRSDSFEYGDGQGGIVKPPIWAHRWVMSTATEKNKKGTFKGYVLGLAVKKPDGSDDVPIKSFVKKSDPLYVAAKDFGKFVEEGKADVDYGAAKPDGEAPSDDIEM